MKRLLAIFVCAALLVCCAPFTVSANVQTTADGFEYTVSTDEKFVTVTGYTGDKTVLTVPSEIEGYPVKAIGNNAFAYSDIEKMTLEGNVEIIGEYAFDSCAALTSLKLCHGVRIIGNAAFAFCKSLSSLTMTYSVERIGWRAFYQMNNEDRPTSLTFIGTEKQWSNIDIDPSNNLSNFPEVTFVGQIYYYFGGVEYGVDTETLEAAVTGYTDDRKSIEILPEINGYPVKYIACSAFAGNPYVKTVSVPESITEIKDSAFISCKNLESVCIGNVETIGYGAFSDCANLKTIEIKEGLKTLSQLAFGDCPLLSSVALPEGVLEIGPSSFVNCSSLETINIPDSVRKIGSYAFQRCCNLKNIDLPNVLSVEVGVFEECYALESIELPITIDSINSRAFSNCTSLKEITIPALVTNIGSFAFYGCTSLSTINILPLGIEKIDRDAFGNCTSLERLTIPRTVTFIGEGVTDGCENLSGIDYHGTRQEWKKIETKENNNHFLSLSVKYHFVATKSPLTFEYDRENLTATLTGFNSSTATVLEIPSEINGFTVTKVKSTVAYNSSTKLTDVIVPPTVTEIGAGAFERCSQLERVTLHAGLEKIGSGAFYYGIDECIYFVGTEDEWNSIEIDEKNNSLFLSVKIKFVRNGDANGDGKQNANDAYLLKGYLAGKINTESIDTERADMNGDGIITAADSLLLKRKIVGA